MGSILLILVVGYGAILCYRNLADQFRDVRITLLISAIFWIVAKIYAESGLLLSETIESFSTIIAYSVILVALLMMIRQLKPDIFRYPYLAVFMPLAIPFSYYITYQISLMRDTILHSVSGMTVLVILIISVGYRDRLKPFLSILAGSFLLAISITGSFFLDEDQYNELLWYAISSIGIAFSAYGFIFTFNQNKHTYIKDEKRR